MGNTKIRPIAMKCNQEQFDAVKSKLSNFSQIIGGFKSLGHLTNYLYGNENKIGNIYSDCAKDHERTVYETWNEEIFLNACGIETEPTYTITKDIIEKYQMKDEFPDVFEVKKKMTQEQIESELGYEIEIIQP